MKLLLKEAFSDGEPNQMRARAEKYVRELISKFRVKPDVLKKIAQKAEEMAQNAGMVSSKNSMFNGDEGWQIVADIINNFLSSINEAEYQGRKVTLNKPTQGDVKKFKVYVKDPQTDNVKKVNFGDPDMKIKKNNPKRRKSFRARHNCDNPGPKTKARYWSCKKW